MYAQRERVKCGRRMGPAELRTVKGVLGTGCGWYRWRSWMKVGKA